VQDNQIAPVLVQKRVLLDSARAISANGRVVTGPAGHLEIVAADGAARLAKLCLGGRSVSLPAFMPVGTAAAVKSLTPSEVAGAGFELILANTYHLMLRPGVDVIREAGGVARFMAWDGPVLTDSGGYQVFSLARRCEVAEAGVRFASHVDGAPLELSPERAYRVQRDLGADVAMALDVCPAAGASPGEVEEACAFTTRWLDRTLGVRREGGPLVFGICQGGTSMELRRAHLEAVSVRDVDGVALGGLSVGEDRQRTREVIAEVAPRMDPDRPRYLMGMGTPEDIVHAVSSGIDLFDCVLPTRSARHGVAYTARGRLSIKQARFTTDPEPLDPDCGCPVCRTFERRYLRHLFVTGELLAARLLTLHNLFHYARLMDGIRRAIGQGRLASHARRTLESYATGA
jgi:queuine tRNA-ribosyltransferase